MVFAAMGSDTGGSIRIPASYCGVVGLKPTSGRVSRYGVMPLDFSLDHMGPLTRSVRDAALILNVIAGYDERDDSSSHRPVEDYLPPGGVSFDGARIGIPENFFFERIDPEVEESVRSAVREAQRLGAEIVPVRVPDIAAINVVGRVILMCEASALLEPYLDADSGRRGDFGADVLLLLDQGRLLAATDYVNAQRLRRQMQRDFAAVWKRVDCLFTPATPITAPPIGAPTVRIQGSEEDTRIASTRLARSLNVLGVPALSMPCGFSATGMPIGLQIVAPAFAEARLLRIAAAMEDALALKTGLNADSD
jgi:aspartyl-tRNA(Asn)/glutamyl-tRNA(Gln) amidotransferase subunit A